MSDWLASGPRAHSRDCAYCAFDPEASDKSPAVLVVMCVAQLAALRQQIASLRAENLALRTALGGDKEAAAVMAAAGRGSVGSHCFAGQLQFYTSMIQRSQYSAPGLKFGCF